MLKIIILSLGLLTSLTAQATSGLLMPFAAHCQLQPAVKGPDLQWNPAYGGTTAFLNATTHMSKRMVSPQELKTPHLKAWILKDPTEFTWKQSWMSTPRVDRFNGVYIDTTSKPVKVYVDVYEKEIIALSIDNPAAVNAVLAAWGCGKK